MVVAGHVAPPASVLERHHCTVLPRQEVAVGLTSEPVLIELRDTSRFVGSSKVLTEVEKRKAEV